MVTYLDPQNIELLLVCRAILAVRAEESIIDVAAKALTDSSSSGQGETFASKFGEL